MKPTAKMLSGVRSKITAGAEKRKHPAKPVEQPGRPKQSESRELAALGKLTGGVAAAARDYARDIRVAALAAPRNVPPGLLAVRIVGVDRDGPSMPLPGVRVGLTHEKRSPNEPPSLEEKTNQLGVAVFELNAPAEGLLVVLGGNDLIIERLRFEMGSDQGLGLLIEVGAEEALRSAFVRGKRTQEHFMAAAHKLDQESEALERDLHVVAEKLARAAERDEKARTIPVRKPNPLILPD